MGAHNNVHIPKESWPGWIWHTIEFGIVLAISMLVAQQITDPMLGDIAVMVGQQDALESWEDITIHSKSFVVLDPSIRGPIESTAHWIFYSIVAGIFLGWYIIIRSIILKKRILNNR